MITEVSSGHDGQYVLTTEGSDPDLGGLVGIVRPVLTVNTDDDDMVGEVLGDVGDLLDAPASDAVLPHFKVAGFFEAGLERDDPGVSSIRCSTYIDCVEAGYERGDRGILSIRLSTWRWGSGDRNRPNLGVLGHGGVA